MELDDRLKELESVMHRAVYQKQRFTDQTKREILERVRSEKRSPGVLGQRVKYVMSIAVFMLVSGFLIGYATNNFTKDTQENAGNLELPVASLPLINQAAIIAERDPEVLQVTMEKVEHWITIRMGVDEKVSTDEMKGKVSTLLREGTELSSMVDQYKQRGDETMDVWRDYSLTIYVSYEKPRIKKLDFVEEDDMYVLKGIKERNSDRILWESMIQQKTPVR